MLVKFEKLSIKFGNFDQTDQNRIIRWYKNDEKQ